MYRRLGYNHRTERGEAAKTWRIGIGEEREGRSKSCWEQETADRPPLLQQSRFWNLCEDRRRSLTRVTDTGRTGRGRSPGLYPCYA